MKMLGGSYGEGSLFFSPYSSELKISPNKGWKTHVFPIDEITAYEEVGVATSSSLGKAGVGAAAGFLLAGPLAGLAGMAWGASSGSTNSFTFGLGFNNGDSILVNASAKDYAEFKAAISNLSFFKPAAQASNVNNGTNQQKSSRKTKKVSRPQVIEGRSRKKAPTAETPLAVEFRQLEENAGNDTDEKEFYNSVNTRIEELNTIKWRHFDELVSADEVKECVCMAVAFCIEQVSIFRDSGKQYREWAKDSREYAKNTRENAGFFGKSKAEQEAKEEEDQAREYNTDAAERDKSADDYERKVPILTSLAERHIDKQLLVDSLKRYKKKNNVTKVFALKLIDRLRPEKLEVDVSQVITNEQANSNGLTKSEATPEERLEKLSNLKEKGLITEDEYKEQRAAIISQI